VKQNGASHPQKSLSLSLSLVRQIESCINLACLLKIYAAAASSPEQKEKLSPRCRSCSSSAKPFFHNFIKLVCDNGFCSAACLKFAPLLLILLLRIPHLQCCTHRQRNGCRDTETQREHTRLCSRNRRIVFGTCYWPCFFSVCLL
jgi:hypothetical protein